MKTLNPLTQSSIETIVREALMLGMLSPEAQTHLQDYAEAEYLSAEETRCLEILDDAIASGCVQVC